LLTASIAQLQKDYGVTPNIAVSLERKIVLPGRVAR
jgi:hypothetical protein